MLDNNKFALRCSNALGRLIVQIRPVPDNFRFEDLGYTREQLAKHIFEHPEYDQAWEMDFDIGHIFPIQAFIDHGIHDLTLINCLENLRPLSRQANLSKADKYNKVEFLNWLKGRSDV